MKSNLLFSVLFISAILYVSSCGSSSDEDAPMPMEQEDPELQQISITSSDGNRLDIFTEETTTLTVSGTDQFQAAFEINSEIVWSVDNDHVTVDAAGKVTAVSVGESVVTAEVGSISSTFSMSVWDSSAPRTEIYVSDVGLNRNGPHLIIRYDEFGKHPETFINTGLSRPQDIVFLEDQGVVLVSSLGSNDIDKFDIETGEHEGTFAGGLAAPTRIDIGPDNLLYVLPWNGGFVKRYELDGTFVDDFTDTGINQSIGMAWDSDGHLYVSSFSDGNGGFVREFDTDGKDLGLFISSNLFGPTDIWFDAEGNMLVNDWQANNVKIFDSSGEFIRTFISGVLQPEGVAIMEDGSILIGESGRSAVKQYDSEGNFIKNLVTSGRGGLITPNAVVLRKVN